ncbi:MAG: MarR family winged helix-turn-helix transcriptional regulator [Mycobacterium sp.]
MTSEILRSPDYVVTSLDVDNDEAQPKGGLPGRVLGRLFAVAPSVVALSELGLKDYGLSYARGRVVAVLAESGPMVMRALSQELGVTPRTVTGLVDALEADGWVARRPHASDRRATVIELTPSAKKSYATLEASYRHFANRLLSDLPADDLERALVVIGQIEDRLSDALLGSHVESVGLLGRPERISPRAKASMGRTAPTRSSA